MSNESLTLDIISTGDVFLHDNRLTRRSNDPMQSAALKLREMNVGGNVAINFRKLGKLVRAVTLSKTH